MQELNSKVGVLKTEAKGALFNPACLPLVSSGIFLSYLGPYSTALEIEAR